MSDPDADHRVLILGGTREAAELASLLSARDHVHPITSFAGRTRAPRSVAGERRVGGFGGVDGLASYLRDHAIGALVDAAHPFAARIKTNAVAASARAAVPLLRLERPAWRAGEGDDWHHAADWEEANALVSSMGQRVLAAVGSKDAASLDDTLLVRWYVRAIEEPARMPASATWLPARPPFDTAADAALMRELAIDCVLAKNAGGKGAVSKLEAARQLRIPVVLVARPALPPADSVSTVSDAVVQLDALLGLST